MATSEITREQAAADLFADIATEAYSLRQLCNKLVGGPQDEVGLLGTAAEAMAARIGAIADIGQIQLGHDRHMVEPVSDWLLSLRGTKALEVLESKAGRHE